MPKKNIHFTLQTSVSDHSDRVRSIQICLATVDVPTRLKAAHSLCGKHGNYAIYVQSNGITKEGMKRIYERVAQQIKDAKDEKKIFVISDNPEFYFVIGGDIEIFLTRASQGLYPSIFDYERAIPKQDSEVFLEKLSTLKKADSLPPRPL